MTQTRPDPAHTGFGDCACDDCYPAEAMAEPPVSAAVSPADTPESESQPDGLKSGGQISGRPVVSPADTIRRAHELLAQIAEWEARNAEREPSERLTSVVFGHKTVGPLVAALLAVGERDKAELSGLRVEFGEWVKAIHEAFAGREVDPQSDGPERIRRLVCERQQGEERGERDRQRIAQLTEALKEARPYVEWFAGDTDNPTAVPVLARVDAVLVGEVGGPTPEEDAMGDHPDRPDFDPLAGEVKS